MWKLLFVSRVTVTVHKWRFVSRVNVQIIHWSIKCHSQRRVEFSLHPTAHSINSQWEHCLEEKGLTFPWLLTFSILFLVLLEKVTFSNWKVYWQAVLNVTKVTKINDVSTNVRGNVWKHTYNRWFLCNLCWFINPKFCLSDILMNSYTQRKRSTKLSFLIILVGWNKFFTTLWYKCRSLQLDFFVQFFLFFSKGFHLEKQIGIYVFKLSDISIHSKFPQDIGHFRCSVFQLQLSITRRSQLNFTFTFIFPLLSQT